MNILGLISQLIGIKTLRLTEGYKEIYGFEVTYICAIDTLIYFANCT